MTTAAPPDAEVDAAIERLRPSDPTRLARAIYRAGYAAGLARAPAAAPTHCPECGEPAYRSHLRICSRRPAAPAQATEDGLVRRLHGPHGSGLLDRLGGAQRMFAAGVPISSYVAASLDNEAAQWMRDAADALAALRAENARLTRDVAKWDEFHRVIAEELGQDAATWPDHRNAPLAIAATFVLHKGRALKAEARADRLAAVLRNVLAGEWQMHIPSPLLLAARAELDGEDDNGQA